MKISDKKRFILSICVISILVAVSFIYGYSTNPLSATIEDGFVDLSGNGALDKVLALKGEWDFYKNKLYDSAEIDTAQDGIKVKVPAAWTSYDTLSGDSVGFGFATYRIKVKVADVTQPLALYLPVFATSFEIFAGMQRVAAGGVVGESPQTSQPYYKVMTSVFNPPSKNFDLIVHVSNYIFDKGGMQSAISIGSPDAVDNYSRSILLKDGLLYGALLIMIMFYIFYTFFLNGEKISIYLILLCILFLVRTLFYGNALVSFFFPTMPFNLMVFLIYTTYFWIPVLVLFVVSYIFYGNKLKRQKIIFLVITLIASTATAILPVSVYSNYLIFARLVVIIAFIFLLAAVVKAFLKGKSGSSLMLVSMVLLLITAIFDILYQLNFTDSKIGELLPFSAVVILVSFGYIIAQRHALLLRQEVVLANEISAANEKEKKAIEELSKSELSFLKAQIKPHFLYNSISVICSVISTDPEQAKNLLYNLADYLRSKFRFDKESGTVSLSEEIYAVKAYLLLEKARFEERLNIVYDIEEFETKIPALAVQPIVENAVFHGIFAKGGNGTIMISVHKDNGYACISVKDDGIGIPEDKMSSILDENSRSVGIGLSNINRRLNLIYGEKLEIKSVVGEGTEIIMKIPINEGLI